MLRQCFSTFLCGSDQCSSTFLSTWNTWYTFTFVMEPPLTKIKKHELLVRKSNISLLDTSTKKQLLHKLKKILMTRLFLHFWNVSDTFRIWQKEPVSQICVAHFLTFAIELRLVSFGLGSYFTFELVYITHYRPHLRCCYYFTSHKKISYYASSGLTKLYNVGFHTVFTSFPQRLNSSCSPLSTL